MIEQTSLFAPMVEPAYPKGATIEERFHAFHLANMHVYDALAYLARKWRAHRPDRQLGVATLFEQLRWAYGMQTTGDEFRLNNNFRSRYARLLMTLEPDLDGIFETRELRAR